MTRVTSPITHTSTTEQKIAAIQYARVLVATHYFGMCSAMRTAGFTGNYRDELLESYRPTTISYGDYWFWFDDNGMAQRERILSNIETMFRHGQTDSR